MGGGRTNRGKEGEHGIEGERKGERRKELVWKEKENWEGENGMEEEREDEF